MTTQIQRFIEASVLRAKAEILSDIRAGIVPATVRNLADLHDASEYGGLTDDDWLEQWGLDYGDIELGTGVWEAIELPLSRWLKAGMTTPDNDEAEPHS